MAISPKMVQELRAKTGVGMMDCKHALEEAGGEMDKAVKILRTKGMATAEKKSARPASEGLVEAKITGDKRSGAIIELNCETDFVAKTDDFQGLVEDLAAQALESQAKDAAALLEEPFQKDSAHKVSEVIVAKVAKLGENIQFRRFTRFEGDHVGAYIHAGGKIGVLIEFECESGDVAGSDAFEQLVKDMAMQVAASAPRFVRKEEVTDEILAREKEIYLEQAIASGKPENIAEKIVFGKMNKFYEENCLLDQAFIKDTGKKVKDVVAEVVSQLGSKVDVKRFARYVLGEGLPSSACGA